MFRSAFLKKHWRRCEWQVKGTSWHRSHTCRTRHKWSNKSHFMKEFCKVQSRTISNQKKSEWLWTEMESESDFAILSYVVYGLIRGTSYALRNISYKKHIKNREMCIKSWKQLYVDNGSVKQKAKGQFFLYLLLP